MAHSSQKADCSRGGGGGDSGQSEIDEHKPRDCEYSNYIVYNNEFIAIEWDKVVLWSE